MATQSVSLIMLSLVSLTKHAVIPLNKNAYNKKLGGWVGKGFKWIITKQLQRYIYKEFFPAGILQYLFSLTAFAMCVQGLQFSVVLGIWCEWMWSVPCKFLLEFLSRNSLGFGINHCVLINNVKKNFQRKIHGSPLL